MSIFKISCTLVLTLTLTQAWAEDKQNAQTITTHENNIQNASTDIPPVTLPQDQDEIDAAPDDNEFAPSEETIGSKETDPK